MALTPPPRFGQIVRMLLASRAPTEVHDLDHMTPMAVALYGRRMGMPQERFGAVQALLLNGVGDDEGSDGDSDHDGDNDAGGSGSLY